MSICEVFSYALHARKPRFANPLHLADEPLRCDLGGAPGTVRQLQRRQRVRRVERIEQEFNIRRLHCAKRGLEIRVAQSDNWGNFSGIRIGRWRTPCHVYDYDELYTRVREPAVSCEAFVDGLEEAKVLIDSFGTCANVEDVETGVEEEGHVEHFVLVGWEEGDVEGIVLGEN